MILELNFSQIDAERLWHTGHHSFVSKQIERFETDDTDYSENRSGESDPTLRGIMEFDKLHPKGSSLLWCDSFLNAKLLHTYFIQSGKASEIIFDTSGMFDGEAGGYVVWVNKPLFEEDDSEGKGAS